MSLCRVFEKPDGSVSIMSPIPVKDMTPLEVLDRDTNKFNTQLDHLGQSNELKDLPYEDVDTADIPASKEHRAKWRKHPTGIGVIVDYTIVTPAELRKVDEDALDAELAKPNPNAVAIARLQRKMQKGNY